MFAEGVKSARGETAILGRGDHTRNTFGTPLHIAYCRQTIALETAEKNAIVLRPLRAIASHELLHELLRWQTTIAAAPLAESTPSPNTQVGGEWDRFVIMMTFSDVFLPVPFWRPLLTFTEWSGKKCLAAIFASRH